MSESTRSSSDSIRLLDESKGNESEVSVTIESLNCEWEEVVQYPDGTVERRLRHLQRGRSGIKIGLKVILVVGLLLGLMFKADVLAPIAREVFKVLSG